MSKTMIGTFVLQGRGCKSRSGIQYRDNLWDEVVGVRTTTETVDHKENEFIH
jgi:hypothetical protein